MTWHATFFSSPRSQQGEYVSYDDPGYLWRAFSARHPLPPGDTPKDRKDYAMNRLKANRLLWSPARYEGDSRAKGSPALEVSCLVLDFDNGTTPQAAMGAFEGYAAWYCTSLRHTSADPRFHLIVPLLRPVKAEEWTDRWKALVESMGLDADHAAKDPKRMFFMPFDGTEMAYQHGDLFQMPGAPKAESRPPAPLRTPSQAETLRLANNGRRLLERLRDDLASTAEGERNHEAFKAAARAAEFVNARALDEAEVLAALLPGAVAAGLPEDEATRALSNGLEKGIAGGQMPEWSSAWGALEDPVKAYPLVNPPLEEPVYPSYWPRQVNLEDEFTKAHLAGLEKAKAIENSQRLEREKKFHDEFTKRQQAWLENAQRLEREKERDAWRKALNLKDMGPKMTLDEVMRHGAPADEPKDWFDERFGTARELGFSEPAPVAEYLLRYQGDGELQRGKLGLVCGDGGIGKSYSLLDLAVLSASKRLGYEDLPAGRWLGRYDLEVRGPALCVFAEDDKASIHRRVQNVGKGRNGWQDDLCILWGFGENLAVVDRDGNPTAFLAKLAKVLKTRQHWGVIILDPLSQFSSGDMETDQERATATMRTLQGLMADAPGLPPLLIGHHTSQAANQRKHVDVSAIRGVTAIPNAARWAAVMMKGPKHDKYGELVRWRVVKNNDERMGDYTVLHRPGHRGGTLTEVPRPYETLKEAKEQQTARDTGTTPPLTEKAKGRF